MEPLLTILQDEADDVDMLPVRTEQTVLTGSAPGGAFDGAFMDEAELSLVRRAERIFRHGHAPEDAAFTQTRIYSDGYERRSPTQSYRVPEGYYRRLIWKAILYAVATVFLLLLALVLIKGKILRF